MTGFTVFTSTVYNSVNPDKLERVNNLMQEN